AFRYLAMWQALRETDACPASVLDGNCLGVTLVLAHTVSEITFHDIFPNDILVYPGVGYLVFEFFSLLGLISEKIVAGSRKMNVSPQVFLSPALLSQKIKKPQLSYFVGPHRTQANQGNRIS
ncbi:MAG: hypothetical protein RJQ21_03770, partial [Rhodospirillales bacterium]